MKALRIIDGIVENAIVIASISGQSNMVDASKKDIDGKLGNIGDSWDGSKFTTPEPTSEELLNEWIRELQGYDFLGVTRTIENIITSMSAAQQGRVDSVTMDRYNAKLAVRRRKP